MLSEKRLSVFVMVIVLAGLVPVVGAAPVGRQDGCGDAAIPVHAIQGSGMLSPMVNGDYTVEGVVVGDFQDTGAAFGGFFIQEEDSEGDNNPATSEGVFVYDDGFGVDVQIGDVVRVTGRVLEYDSDGVSLTELGRLQSVTVCESGISVTPSAITLPLASVSDWERYEGMLVTFPQALTVNDVYDLGRYGTVTLVAGGRLYVPTHKAAPGADAAALQAQNDLRRVVLDDGSGQQNRDPAGFPASGLSGTNSLRAGDTITGLTVVVDHRFGEYRVQAVGPVEFDSANPRANAPEPVGGRLRVAGFNVLNYFNGDGSGGGFPTSRGADNPDEFRRQRDKIISGLLGLDADIIGLIEIENDGDGPDSAIADLVDGLNAIAGAGTYAYINDPAGWRLPDQGADEIKQALIYRPAAVTPVGDPAFTLDPPYDSRRPPVAQTFEDAATGERLTVVVNHFKSKGCTGASGDNADQGDGQGCWNAERVQAAHTLTAWLASDPTGSGDPDVLLLGDFNAYGQEDPVTTLAAAGYTNLDRYFEGNDVYSYVYEGQSGTLDYAFASDSLVPQVNGLTTWHINADEPTVLDYNQEYKSDQQVTAFYDAGPFRSSDHDPVLVGLSPGEDTGAEPHPDGNGGSASGDGDSGDGTSSIIGAVLGIVAVIVVAVIGLFVRRNRSQ
ncbi:MAG: ExeM/NucH family extracellular endonuclease [Anaerolineae bacterium]|nr:ExeM/NucH family extracellular endonuclease [Anaerolineae bacterium]